MNYKILPEQFRVLARLTVMNIIYMFRNTGRIYSLKNRLLKVKNLYTENRAYIMDLINEDSSIRIRSLGVKLLHEKNISVSASTIERAL